jgi:hypothetical protein
MVINDMIDLAKGHEPVLRKVVEEEVTEEVEDDKAVQLKKKLDAQLEDIQSLAVELSVASIQLLDDAGAHSEVPAEASSSAGSSASKQDAMFDQLENLLEQLNDLDLGESPPAVGATTSASASTSTAGGSSEKQEAKEPGEEKAKQEVSEQDGATKREQQEEEESSGTVGEATKKEDAHSEGHDSDDENASICKAGSSDLTALVDNIMSS